MVNLGQHFLRDRAALHDIVAAAELTPRDVVLEIGPGEGVLTEELAQRARQVIAVELDRSLVAVLQKRFHVQKNVTIVHNDILRWWPNGIFKYLNIEKFKYFKVVANLPYAITSRVLRMLLEKEPRPSLLVLLVQKEVAERICAKPGAMSLLSVSVQYYATPEIIRVVPRTAFDPPPKVDSAILKIVPTQKRGVPENHAIARFSGRDFEKNSVGESLQESTLDFEREFFRLVKIGFSARRKQLASTLASVLRVPREEAQQALVAIGLPPTARPQDLSVAQWEELARSLARSPLREPPPSPPPDASVGTGCKGGARGG